MFAYIFVANNTLQKFICANTKETLLYNIYCYIKDENYNSYNNEIINNYLLEIKGKQTEEAIKKLMELWSDLFVSTFRKPVVEHSIKEINVIKLPEVVPAVNQVAVAPQRRRPNGQQVAIAENPLPLNQII